MSCKELSNHLAAEFLDAPLGGIGSHGQDSNLAVNVGQHHNISSNFSLTYWLLQAICVPIRRIAGKIFNEAFENKVFIKLFLAESGVLGELPHCLRKLPPSSQSPSLNSIQSTGWDLLKGLVNLG
jgi:hypothetical protein